MQKVTGEDAPLVAATLVQAEMLARGIGAPTTSRSTDIARRFTDYRAIIADAYEHYLTLVTTGERPVIGED